MTNSFLRAYFLRILAFTCLIVAAAISHAADPLPSWRDGASKQAIISFVKRVTNSRGADYVSPPERIAVFDNDGTLWAEQPIYFPLMFAFDRLRALAPQHPEWQEKPVLKAVIQGDMKGALSAGEPGLIEVIEKSHEGDVDAFRAEVKAWMATTRHPLTKRPYDAMAYQPMLDLLSYLRANDFKTFIVSGGDVEFMRAFVERLYGVPPEQVIGSRLKLTHGEMGTTRVAAIEHLNDREGKVVAIANSIGRRPILAFGNSDGDLAMLSWTAAGPGPRLAGYVHHTDAVREFAYDRNSKIGRLDKGLDVAKSKGWVIADMASDWATVYRAGKP